jgi:3-isopropylmalate/(R)-2-methylmalate dehydratase small subunit
MRKFDTLKSTAACLLSGSVDTDQIVPARFLSTRREAGYADYLFHDLRHDSSGMPDPDFFINRISGQRPAILIAGSDFGCGSSREAAVYALSDFGFRAVVAPSFGEIFHYNCLRNGVLAAQLPAADVERLAEAVTADPQAVLEIDLDAEEIRAPGLAPARFGLDAFWKELLLTGSDEVSITLGMRAGIEAFESLYYRRHGWLEPKRPAGARHDGEGKR